MTTTGAGRLVDQTDELRFVVDCSVNPTAFVGQLTITFVPEAVIVSCGGGCGCSAKLKKNGSMLGDRSNPFWFCAAESPLPAKVP